MTTTVLPTSSDQRAVESHWAVETHGLTKRFGDNVAVNGVELLVPRGCAFGYLGPQRRGQDHPHPSAARTDPRRRRHDVPARIPSSRGTATRPWPGSEPSSTSRGSTAI